MIFKNMKIQIIIYNRCVIIFLSISLEIHVCVVRFLFSELPHYTTPNHVIDITDYQIENPIVGVNQTRPLKKKPIWLI